MPTDGPHGHPDPPPSPAPDAVGPLTGLRVVELAGERTEFAGRMLADFGAEVILVEPPGGAHQRTYGPFVDDVADPERSLWFWHYNTNKFGVVLDLDEPDGRARFADLAGTADVVLEGETPGRLAALGVDEPDLRAANPALVWTSVTPFGRTNPRALEPMTDLTLLANAGPVWSCGYDDHTVPPVRGGGNQGFQTAGIHAAIATLVAVLHRDASGRGQHVDVSMHAANNVTTEFATYGWLVARETVQRQTCRHAAARPTQFTMSTDKHGRFTPTGVPPRTAKEFRTLIDWIDHHGWRDDFPGVALLELGEERGGVSFADIASDPLVGEIFGAGRDALIFIASRLSSYEFFLEGQTRGLALPVIYSPEEVMADPHFRARGMAVEREHPGIGRTVTYAGAPITMDASPWRWQRHAPTLGEHQHLADGAAGGQSS